MLFPDFTQDLSQSFSGEICTDFASRVLYSTDASIYQIEPLGVAFPRTTDDLSAVVELAARYQIPILARGAGSSLAGQAIGPALIVDCSRYLDHIIEIDPEARHAIVEPGVVLNALDRAAAPHGLQFGPDPASAERATIGGSIANNASGAHSILYGMCADHLLSADVVLADGSLAALNDGAQPPNDESLLADIYCTVNTLRERYADLIRARWPRTWRNASGYNLHYLLPWIPSSPPGWRSEINPAAVFSRQFSSDSQKAVNLTPLLAGSEGTLAVIRRAKLNLVPRPQHTILAVLTYSTGAEACEAVPDLLAFHPSAIELIPHNLIHLAHTVPAAAHSLAWLNDLPEQSGEYALLIVEFSGDNLDLIEERARSLRADVLLAKTAQAQSQVWSVRKLGLGILQSQPGQPRPVTFIEDMSVPVEQLAHFVREMALIMAEHGSSGDFYAHASAGCLHMRPVLNIQLPDGLSTMRSIALQAANLVASLGGTMSGEHGDGLARSEWLESIYGPELVEAFRQLKAAFDPQGILNPGKIVNLSRTDLVQPVDGNLRDRPLSTNLGWQPVMDFSRNGGISGVAGVVGAIEMCNGAGVCRKAEGVMCPSFQATRSEMNSTRGRANLLRNMLANPTVAASHSAYEALDLCLACKGCKADCPSAVDMAKLKYEFVNAYYHTHRRRLRDYLFGYIGVIAPLGAVFAPFANWIMRNPVLRRTTERFFGLSCHRPFPAFKSQSSKLQLSSNNALTSHPKIIFLTDTFNRYFYPETELAARQVLAAIGVEVLDLPILGAGRTLISKGFLEPAKRHADRLLTAIYHIDPVAQLPIVGLEPSEIYTLRDEFVDFFPHDERSRSVAERAWMIDEYLLRIPNALESSFQYKDIPSSVLLHGHCYQKAQPPAADGLPVGVAATVALLKAIGYQVQVIDDGCCGMAGAFGYEAEHYDLSMKVGELALFPAVRSADPGVFLSAAGVSCQAQIEDGTRRIPRHPIQLVADVLVADTPHPEGRGFTANLGKACLHLIQYTYEHITF